MQLSGELEDALIYLVFIPFLLIAINFKLRMSSASLSSLFSCFPFFPLKQCFLFRTAGTEWH